MIRMLQRLCTLMTLLALCLCLTPAEAAADNSEVTPVNIAVVLDTPGGYSAEPEKVYTTIKETLNKIFTNKSLYNLQPIEDNDAYVQIYREENGFAMNEDTGVVTTNGARDLSLKKNDLSKLNEHFGADHLIYIRITNSMPQVTVGFMTAGQKVNVTMDFRVWSKEKNDFTYMKRTMTTGSSSSFYVGIGSSSNAIEEGIKKGLTEVEKDAVKIRTSMLL